MFIEVNSQQKAIITALAKLERARKWPSFKCALVIAVAMDQLESSGEKEAQGDDEFDNLYQNLIELARAKEFLIGQGNLGLEGDIPAPARNTECTLTEAGRKLGRSFFPEAQ